MSRNHTVTLSRDELEELERKADLLDSLVYHVSETTRSSVTGFEAEIVTMVEIREETFEKIVARQKVEHIQNEYHMMGTAHTIRRVYVVKIMSEKNIAERNHMR
jgi:hypothetical protein